MFLSALDEETVINPCRLASACMCAHVYTRERRHIHTCLLPLMITLTHLGLIQCVITWSHKHSLRPTCYHKHTLAQIHTRTQTHRGSTPAVWAITSTCRPDVTPAMCIQEQFRLYDAMLDYVCVAQISIGILGEDVTCTVRTQTFV